MRTKTVTRYYCDHCNRGMFKRPSMIEHERCCIRNPERACALCEQKPDMPTLVKAIESGLDAVRDAADGCPACVLAAIVQDREAYKKKGEEPPAWVDFDYKEELAAWHRGQLEESGVALCPDSAHPLF